MSGFPLPLLLLDRVPVAAAVVFLLHLEGGRHGGHGLDRGRVDIVDDVKGLLPVLVRNCCAVICMTQLPLLPLSDLDLVVVAADTMVFQLHLEGRASW